MTYREYVYNGQLQRHRDGGMRLDQIQADELNPDGRHWKFRATQEQQKMADFLGDYNYRLWAEVTWPDEVIQEQTWFQIYETAHAAVELGEAVFSQIECACAPDGNACAVCAARARLSEREHGITY